MLVGRGGPARRDVRQPSHLRPVPRARPPVRWRMPSRRPTGTASRRRAGRGGTDALPDRRHRRARAREPRARRGGDRDARAAGTDARARPARPGRASTHEQLAPRDRRAPRPRPPRPRRLQGRHGGGEPDRRAPAPSATRRCRSRSSTSARCSSRWPTPRNVLAVDDIALMTGYEVRPAVASPRGHRRARSRRLTRLDDVVRDGRRGGRRGRAARRGRRPARVRRRRAGHQARQPDHRPGGRAGRLGHPLRARRQRRCACASASTACSQTSTTVPRRMVAGVVSRIKIMGDLDIAERRIPQDGRVGLTIDGHHVDLRVVTLPSVHGEGVVMRILDKDSVRDRPRQARHGRPGARRASSARSARPTARCSSPARPARASRRRCTRRSTELNTPEKNIITIEDPVEYQLDGHHAGAGQPAGRPDVRQRPALDDARRPRHHHGRRDPRPRDGADRRSRPRSPATSCSRRCTPTTRRAPITRLIEMGIEPFLVASRDRLRRRPAPGAHAVPALQAAHDHPAPTCCATTASTSHVDLEAYEPGGLRALRRHAATRAGSGLYEVMIVTEEIRQLALERALGRRDRARSRCARACAGCATTACEKVTPGPHLDRRGRPRHRQRLRSCVTPTIRRSSSDARAGPMDAMRLRLRRPAARGRSTAGPPTSTSPPASPPMVRVRGRLSPLEGYPKLDAHGHARDHLLDPHQRPAPAAGDRLAARLRLLDPRPRPLPRQRLLPARARIGAAFRLIPSSITLDRRARPAARRPRASRKQAARLRARHRPDRLGQVDVARGDDRRDQRDARGAHHDDRGPDRVPARRTRSASSTSASSGSDAQSFADGAEGRAAPGPRRDPRRRDARPRDDLAPR